MEQNDFRDENTGLCKLFEKKAGQGLFVNVEDPSLFEHYRARHCYKGNIYADYCEYCAKNECLYYKPEVNLVPKGQEKIVIMDSSEMEKRNKNMPKNDGKLPFLH